MNQQQVPQEQPKVKELKKERDYKLQENGDVILTESVVTEITFKARQFISYRRQYDKGIEDMTKQLSKEHLEEIKKHKTLLEEQLKPIAPICEKVDKIVKEQYIEQQKTQTTAQLKQWLNQKEVNLNAVGAIWSGVPKEHKEDIMKALTKEEQTKLLNLKLDKMKTERGKK